MKSSKIDRIISVVVIGTCLIKAVLYGGSKPPATTNTPPDDVSCPTNTVGGDVLGAPQPSTNENAFICGCGVPGGHALPLRTVATPQQTEPNILCSPSPSTFTSLTAWNRRGAYCDWVRVEFPDGFEFPCGTNLLTGVTVMAWGEIRSVGRGVLDAPEPPFNGISFDDGCGVPGGHALPMRVSLEPDASSFAHGLTSSNTYLFAWMNCCVEREATNRVDASIELFAWGDMTIRFGNFVTNIVARPPRRFHRRRARRRLACNCVPVPLRGDHERRVWRLAQ